MVSNETNAVLPVAEANWALSDEEFRQRVAQGSYVPSWGYVPDTAAPESSIPEEVSSIHFSNKSEWSVFANCKDEDTSVFYPADNERRPAVERRNKHAIDKYCGSCLVQNQCLAYAMDRREPYGVWGGMSAEARFKLQDQLAG